MKVKIVKTLFSVMLAATIAVGEVGTAAGAVVTQQETVVSGENVQQEEKTEELFETKEEAGFDQNERSDVSEGSDWENDIEGENVLSEDSEYLEEEDILETPSENQEPSGEEQKPSVEETQGPTVEKFTCTEDDGEIYLNISGYGTRFVIKVNGVEWRTENNYDYDYDEETPQKAPYYSESCTFYGLKPGSTYTFEVTPYDSENVAGTSQKVTYKKEMPTVKAVTVYSYTRYVSEEKDTGYNRQPYNSVNIELNHSAQNVKYDLYRAEGKKTAKYKKLTTLSGYAYYDSLYYSDYAVNGNATYYYKVVPYCEKDDYVKAVTGKTFISKGFDSQKPSATCYVSYEDFGKGPTGVSVYASDISLCSGFEFYRSERKNKGYKKIATSAERSYFDRKAKAGKTYYYRVKPFFYNAGTKKKSYGKMSEPAGVKITMGSFNVTYQQTGKDKVKFSWEKLSGNVTYEIYYCSATAGDAYRLIKTTKGNSFSKSGLNTSETHYFQIRACKTVNGVKKYYRSSSQNVYLGLTYPSVTTTTKKVSVDKNGTISIQTLLKWNRIYGASKILLKNNGKTIKTLKGSATKYTIKDSKKKDGDWKYSYLSIVAVKGKETRESDIYGIHSLKSVSNVKVTRKSSTSAKISWKKTAGANRYIVYRSTPLSGEYYADEIGETNATSFEDKALTPGINYRYYVVAKYYAYSDYYYSSVTSNQSEIKIYNHKVEKPVLQAVKNTGTKSVTITWKKAAYAQSYVVYRSENKKGPFKRIGTIKEKTTFVNKGLKKGKKYYYCVQAKTINDAGFPVMSSKSAVKGVTIKK
ncbi:MAG: hypothetical protein ACI4HI_12825 [Lachnospiraceae bacterium]